MIQSCLELERGIVVMIPDIGKLIDKTQKELKVLPKNRAVIVTPLQWDSILSTFNSLETKPKTNSKRKSKKTATARQVGGHTLIIENENPEVGHAKYISCQEFPIWSCMIDLHNALVKVNDGLDEVSKRAGLDRYDPKEPNIFRHLPVYWENDPAGFFETVKIKGISGDSLDECHRKFVEQYNKLNKVLEGKTDEKPETSKGESLSKADLDNLYNFLFKLKLLQNVSSQKSKNKNSKGDEKSDTDTGKVKGLDRKADWKESILFKVGGFAAAASSGRAQLVEVFADIKLTYDKLEFGPEEERPETSGGKSVIERKTGGENLIFYGAPGTGKSYAVRERAKEAGSEFCTVTVFHPDVQNSDFVGCLKPVKTDDKAITYQFAPGPFAIALKNAWLDPEHMHYLDIEEMNRAPAASVFGELFLLLDRDEKGYSIYETDFPSPEFCSWWKNEIVEKGAGKVPGLPSRLKLPSNLSIFATLNSADQGVFPLDTAFRRRWEYKYIQIDYSKAPGGDIELFVKDTPSGPVKVEWKDFVQKLNNFLVNNVAGISEDRLIGTYFLSKRDFANSENLLPEKLLVYIWDDLLRHNGRQELFVSSVRTFGDLSSRQKDKKVIFSESFLELFGSHDGDDQ